MPLSVRYGAPPASVTKPNGVALAYELALEHRAGEGHYLHRDRRAFPEAADELGRVDQDDPLGGEVGQELLAQERPPAPLGEGEGVRHLVRPVEEEVEPIVAAERPDREAEPMR